MNIKIIDCRIVKVEAKLVRPFVTSRKINSEATNYLVFIKAIFNNEVIFGVGEASPRGKLTGDPVGKVYGFFQESKKLIISSSLDGTTSEACLDTVKNLLNKLRELARAINPEDKASVTMRGCYCGIEIALLDVAAKAMEMSICRLLTKNDRQISVTASSMSLDVNGDNIESRLSKQNKRYSGWRIKCDSNIENALKILHSMTDLNARNKTKNVLWLDFNQALTINDSEQLIKNIYTYSLQNKIIGKIILEQPINANSIKSLCALQELANKVKSSDLEIVIMVDEALHTIEDWIEIEKYGACKAINIKLQKAGGILEAIRIAKAAETFDPDIEVYIGGMIATSAITSWAMNQLSRSINNFTYTTAVPHTNLLHSIESESYRFESNNSPLIAKQSLNGLGTFVNLDNLKYVIKECIPRNDQIEGFFVSNYKVDVKRKSLRQLISSALDRRKIEYEFFEASEAKSIGLVEKSGVKFKIFDQMIHFANSLIYVGSVPKLINGKYALTLGDKVLTALAMKSRGIPAPDQYIIQKRILLNKSELRRVFDTLLFLNKSGLVVKPLKGKHGVGVSLNLRSYEEFVNGCNIGFESSDSLIIEPMLKGKVYRFFVINSRVIAVRYGMSESGISNRHQGAKMIDVTNSLHESYKKYAEAAFNVFPNLFVSGIDMIIANDEIPANVIDAPNFHILELNSYPGFLGHHYPDVGDPIDVADALIQGLIDRFSKK